MKATRALFAWIDPYCHEIARRVLNGVEIVERAGVLTAVLQEKLDPAPSVIVCGKPARENQPSHEIVRELLRAYPQAVLLYGTSDRSGFDRKQIENEGGKGGFLMPFESNEFEKALVEVALEIPGIDTDLYRPVKLIDIEGDDELDFDTFMFLPLNGKYIRYSRAGQRLSTEQKERLLDREVSSLCVRQSDLQKFYRFSARQLAKIGKSDTMSWTEKQEKIRDSVRAILSDLFSENREVELSQDGQRLMEDCREIVKSYVLAESVSTHGALYGKILQMSLEGSGPYSHAANVSTFAALFSIGLQIGHPEEVALAGLLHDLGLALVPPDVLEKGTDGRAFAYDFAHDETSIYRQHPEFSIRLIDARRMSVSDNVKNMVLQHHETYSGGGYPKKLAGDQILPESQILAFADFLEEVMALGRGKARMTPRQAIHAILELENQGASNRRFDPKLVDQLMSLFEEKPSAVAA